jgi:DNA helicase HerA-like ATPase
VTSAGEQWAGLLGLPAYRITEIPRRDAQREAAAAGDADPGRPQRAAALAAAYHAGLAAMAATPGATATPGASRGALAFGWIRSAPAGPVRIVTAGDGLVGSTTANGDVLLSLPGGARATPLRPADMSGLLTGIACWREIAGISDGLLTAAGASGPAAVSRSSGPLPALAECLLGSWTGAFGWLVIAAPVPAADLLTLADDVARRLHLAEAVADRFPERAVEARRLAERHAELRRGCSSGFWHVRVLAGARDEGSAARVAGLFCASVPLAGLPYALSPASGAAGSPVVTPAGAPDPSDGDALPASPFRGSTELLAALARPPESEVPGVRLALRPEFDTTPEAGAMPGAAVTIGDVLDGNLLPAGPFAIPLDSLNRHVFVCGATGAGKSQTVRTLLAAAARQGVPWLVIEPAKAEYRLMANRLPGTRVVRIRPGEADAIAAGLNPLQPAAAGGRRFPLQTHADLVRALFVASFRSEEPFPQVLSAALTRVYEDAGWDLALGEPRPGVNAAYPALRDLQRAAEQVVADIGYSQRVTDDVLGFVRVRIASLRAGTTGRFLEGGHPVDFERLLRHNVVLELEDVGDDRDKAFLMGTVLIRLAEHLRLTRAGAPPGLRHLTVVEEAHRLLRRADPGAEPGAAAHAVEMFAGLLAEIRAYGEGLIVAEQIPARLIPDVIKNTSVKLTHRLPAADDRDAVGATMNVTPAQSRYLVTLPPGQAAAFADGMDFPVLVKVQDFTERELLTPPCPASSAPVVTPRSGTCGADCVARPCTLREMRHAQRELSASGWLVAWAELTVLAHLTGWPMPAPKPPRLAEFRRLPARLAQCAVSHAVDAAVAVRVPALDGQVDLGGLAGHACAAILARADRGEWLCAAEESCWRLPGTVPSAVAFGSARPSAIESAGEPAGVLAEFIDCQWPLPYLSAAAP